MKNFKVQDEMESDLLVDPRGLDDIVGVGALTVLKRGISFSPELKTGLVLTAFMALAVAGGKLLVPLTIQAVLDFGISANGVHIGRIWIMSLISIALISGSVLLGKATYYRLVCTAENVLMNLRIRAFTHLHRLSIAKHIASRKGTLVARVTSDVETLTQFAQWGAISWIINLIQIVAVLLIMGIYSWQ